MTERNGVRRGQRVRDLDGTPLGRVARLHDWGFVVTKGFPILFRKDFVARYDEIRGVREGEIVLARSERDLFDLAAGELPPSWRIPAPPHFPSAATPSEARGVIEEIARGAIAADATAVAGEGTAAPAGERIEQPAAEGLTPRDEREFQRTRGQPAAPPPHV